MNSSVFSFKNIYNAYLQCRKHKRGSRSALAFEMNAEENLLNLHRELQERSYAPLPSACFVTESPKMREIFAADFRDRIVHHLLVNHLEPIWEPVFIFDSYACRKGKGTHAAVKRLQHFMRQATQSGYRNAYYIHLDVKSFFISINKRILYDLLKQKETDADILRLLETIIFHDPSKQPVFKGQMSLFRQIPPHKSLFFTHNRTGLPIGNYTSQFFANAYLNKLDQFVKHELKCRYYMRYVDDLILLDEKRSRLEYWENRIDDFLKSHLQIELNPKRRKIAPIRNGCNFLGYIVRPTHFTIRKRVVNNLKSKLAGFESSLIKKTRNAFIIQYDTETIDKLHAVLASYLGQFSHASTFRLKHEIFKRYFFLNHYFTLNNRKLLRVDIPPRFPCLQKQYHWFSRKYRDDFLFFQVGGFFEFYGNRAKIAGDLLQLKPGPFRPRLGAIRGIPCSGIDAFLKQSLEKFDRIVIVRQTGKFAGRLMERRVAQIFYSQKRI